MVNTNSFKIMSYNDIKKKKQKKLTQVCEKLKQSKSQWQAI